MTGSLQLGAGGPRAGKTAGSAGAPRGPRPPDRFLARPGLARQRHVRGPDVRAVLLARGGENGQLAFLRLHRRLEAKVVARVDHPLAHRRAVHHDAEGTAHAAAALRDSVEDRLVLPRHLLPGGDGRRARHSGSFQTSWRDSTGAGRDAGLCVLRATALECGGCRPSSFSPATAAPRRNAMTESSTTRGGLLLAVI